MPDDWIIGRVCEEFGCLPTAAVRELETDPEQRVLRIMRLREYARARAAIDRAQSAAEMPTGRMVEWVTKAQAELVREKIADRHG